MRAVNVNTIEDTTEISKALVSSNIFRHTYRISTCRGKLIISPLTTVTKLCANAFNLFCFIGLVRHKLT